MAQRLKTPAPAADLAAMLRETARHMRGAMDADAARAPKIAVLLPCHDEAASVARVVADFRAALPDARICVFDNNSTDGTAEVARAAGAEVFREPRRGKGAVVRRMFADIDADIYVMADGDGTYDASAAPLLVAAVRDERVDMAVGARAGIGRDAHRHGHAFGNRLFNRLYGALCGSDFTDIFSGYRAFSRRFVKSFPAVSSGFEIETELSVHASQLQAPVVEIETVYGARAEGSASKLRTLHDGARILRKLAVLVKETRPALFFGALAGTLTLTAFALALPLLSEWLATGLVPRLPTAILCTGLVLVACMFGVAGLILDSLARFRVEQKRMLYLAADRR